MLWCGVEVQDILDVYKENMVNNSFILVHVIRYFFLETFQLKERQEETAKQMINKNYWETFICFFNCPTEIWTMLFDLLCAYMLGWEEG